eukprot:39386_1
MAHTSKSQLMPEFNSWISDLDLSSPSLLEDKVDEICNGIEDRLNPKNDIEYIKVMQSHLLLEVWSQIRIFISEQFQKNEFFSNAQITKLNHNQNKNNNPNQKNKKNKKKTPKIRHTYTATISVKSYHTNIQIPFQSYVLLLWKNATNGSFINLSQLQINTNTNQECKQNDDESKTNPKSTFPPHVLVQVATTKTNKNSKNKYESCQEIKLSLDDKSYNIMKENMKKFGKDSNLNVVPIKNLIYLQRDYDAIKNVNKMPLSSYIMGREYLIKRKIKNIDNLFNYISNHGLIKKYYNKKLNKSQNIALQQSLIKPLTLIHGPPGTGKTKYALLPILKCAFLALSLKYDITNRQTLSNLNYNNDFGILSQINRVWKQPRIGVFAGSNQAIDEIILTILNFNKDNNSVYSDLSIARMGNTFNMDANIARDNRININLWIDYYLGFKWDKQNKQELYGYQQKWKQRINKIQNDLRQIEKQIFQYMRQQNGMTQNNLMVNHALWENVKKLIIKSRPLSLELDCLTKIQKIRFPNQAQRMLLPILMNACQILFSTANYLGRCTINATGTKHGKLEKVTPFDFSLFDECCQMRETETLIALQYCYRSVLIGDPKQLQATILYYGKYRNLLLNSLFIRIEKYIEPIMLSEQYRMNVEISAFPSKYFYNNKLLNGDNVKNGEKNKLFHGDKSGEFKPYLFFDIIGVEEKRSNSLINLSEIDCIENMMNKFIKHEEYLKEIKNIGIITPYLAHKQLIVLKLMNIKKFLFEKYRILIECVTVDEFQGSERDIIIFSCVRSNYASNIGFLNDNSRLNVAITRAKYALWIIGNGSCLQSDATWKALLEDVRNRNLMISKHD